MPASGSASATRSSTWPRWPQRSATGIADVFAQPSAQRVHGPRRRRMRRGPRLGPAPCSPTTPTASSSSQQLSHVDAVEHAPAVRGCRLRRLLRQRGRTPPTSARSSAPTPPACRRTGSTSRSATTAAPGTVVVSGSDVVRPTGQRRPGADGVPPFGPTTTLDIECEVGFVVGRSDRARHPGVRRARRVTTSSVSSSSTTGAPATSRRGSTSRSDRSSASRSRPASRPGSCRSRRSPRPRSTCPGRSPAVLPYLQGETDRDAFGLDLHLEVRDQRHGRQLAGVPRHVLVARPDARAPDGQRRQPARR